VTLELKFNKIFLKASPYQQTIVYMQTDSLQSVFVLSSGHV